jgi:hypothetical protein
MIFAIYLTIAFHLFPCISFLRHKNCSLVTITDLGILLLVLTSFTCDFAGIYIGSFGYNTNQITNSYLIISKPLECFILLNPTFIRQRDKKNILLLGFTISLTHLLLCLPSLLFELNDYTTMLASAYVSLLALFAIYNLVFNSISIKNSVHLNVIPSIAIFIYNSITFVPTMITNIDDKIHFPSFIIDLRFWIVIIANILRDAIFSMYFYKKMKVRYDPSE